MGDYLLNSHCIFPTADIMCTANYYRDFLGFRVVTYLESKQPHICLYRDHTEIILTESNGQAVIPNRKLYGCDCEDAYFITRDQEALQDEFIKAGVKIVRPLAMTDYQNWEFTIEDIDGRWISFGVKVDQEKADC